RSPCTARPRTWIGCGASATRVPCARWWRCRRRPRRPSCRCSTAGLTSSAGSRLSRPKRGPEAIMPFFKSHHDDAGPAEVFTAYPEIYGPWADMGQALMQGPSPLTPGEREMIAAYVVGLAECRFAYVAHNAAAHAWGIPEGTVDALLADLDTA